MASAEGLPTSGADAMAGQGQRKMYMKSGLPNPRKFCREIVKHLSKDQTQLAELLRDNAAITEGKSIELVGFDFKSPSTCDLAGVALSFVPKADGRILLAFYPAEENVQLSDFVLTELRRISTVGDIPTAFTVPEGKMVSALDLGAKLQATLSGKAGFGTGNLSFFAQGGVTAEAKFFKLLDANLGARDAVVATASGLKVFFQLGSHSPDPGEIVVTEFAGSLSVGAEIGYGFAISGTRSLHSGLEEVTLESDYEVKTKSSARVNFRLERGLVTIVRATGTAGWVNVSYLKKRDSEAAVALNLSVDAKLSSRMVSDGNEREVGALIDTLLSNTSLPDMVDKLRGWDAPEERKKKADDFIKRVVGQMSSQLRDVLADPVAEVEQFLGPIRDAAEGLIDDIERIDGEVARFMESATDRVDTLLSIDVAVAHIARSASAEDLLVVLSGARGADVRRVLNIIAEAIDLDLSQVSWLERSFTRTRDLARKYGALDGEVRQRFEERYRLLKLQLNVDDAVAVLKEVSDLPTLQAFLDKRVIWVEQYLAKQLNTTVDQILESLEPALRHVRALTGGYDKLVTKATKALESSLTREVSLQASLAWQRVSTQQSLVSVDVNLDEVAGKDAMKDLLRGRIGDVLLDRLTNAHAIRFQKSYFLDQIRSSVWLKLVINGRERLSRSGLLTSNRTVLEPTSSGEIWVQESAVETKVHRSNRRAILNVNTLFEVSLQELYERRGETLTRGGLRLRGYGLRYNYTEALQGAVPAAAVRAQLREVASMIDFELVPADDYDELCDGIEEIGRLGDLGEPTIDIDVAVSREALVEIFSESSTDKVRARVRKAYSRAVRVAFGEFQRVIDFYMARKDSGFDVSEVRSAQWDIKRTSQMMAQNITNSYATFSDQIADIHRHVFLKIGKLGGNTSTENDIQRKRLVKDMRGRLRKLGKKMSWINGIQLGDRPRDFTMAIFAQMIDPSYRSGNIAVHYNHPISNERLTLRVDDPIDEAAVG